ncbi:TonB family protein [Pseudovibrio brasiliensis]|uniref:TonB family protein n=1 Tax=Pseudovibrio brasiliensis TaxID=1898042 RepID=A0ABX8AN34_9HYPH|nr:energy transducer TonB [Pseudovibrio brasiliensis]QUS56497.1 TonB family protein [Pseudovibrio brasiliensis]
MKRGIRRRIGGSALTTALLVSVSVHAAGFAWFYARAPEVQVASTRSTSLSVVGSIEDLIAGTKEVVEPIEPDQPDEIEPREFETETPVEQVKEVGPVEPIEVAKAEIAPVQPVESIVPQAVKPVVVPVTEGVTIKAEVEPIKPTEELEPLERQVQPEQIRPAEVQEVKPLEVAKVQPLEQPKPVEHVKEVEPVKLEELEKVVQSDEVKPSEPEKLEEAKKEVSEELKPVEKKTAEPVEDKKELEAKPVETEVAAVTVPIPRAAPPRPKQVQKTTPKKIAKKASTKAKKEPAKKAGNSEVNSVRGSKVARKGSSAAKKGNNIAGSGDSAGNAAASNYWGKVQKKIQRAANSRYPRREKRRSKSGDVQIRYTIQRDGSVTGITLAVSSGNKRFDEAARKAIRTAAPFDPLPQSIRGNSVTRTTHVQFRIK